MDTCTYLLSVDDPLRQVTRGSLSVRFGIRIFEIKIPAGRIWIDPQVNSWWALVLTSFLAVFLILKYHKDQDHSVSDPAKDKTVVPSSFSLVQSSLQFFTGL